VFAADAGDIKASVAGLQFIISSAAKHDVNCETLSSELQQLGLPKGGGFRIGFVFISAANFIRISAGFNQACPSSTSPPGLDIS